MPATWRENLSLPFLVLGVALAALLAADYFVVPDLFTAPEDVTLLYGGLLVAFTLSYCYRPLRESRYGPLAASLFLLAFAGVVYIQGMRGPLLPYGLFGIALVAFCRELYRFGSRDNRRGQAS